MQTIPMSGSSEARADALRLGQIIMSIARASHGLRDPFAHGCHEQGLTAAQHHAVMWLGAEGPLTMGELAVRSGVTEKTITGLVDRMEELGLARRERDVQDRRVVRVTLTDKGRATHDEARSRLLARVEELLSLLDASERSTLMTVVQKLCDRFLAAVAAESKENPR